MNLPFQNVYAVNKYRKKIRLNTFGMKEPCCLCNLGTWFKSHLTLVCDISKETYELSEATGAFTDIDFNEDF